VQALKDGKAGSTKPAEPVAIQDVVIGKDPKTTEALRLIVQPPSLPARRLVALDIHKFDELNAYEKEWLQELLGPSTPFRVEIVRSDDPTPLDAPIVVVQRPHIEAYTRMFTKWNSESKDFYVLHLSDEYEEDSLDFYTLPHCLGVVRIYQRNDIPASVRSKVLVIPLGYHWTVQGGSDNPIDKTPRLPFRNVLWSFFGTKWMERDEKLKPLQGLGPHTLRLVDTWESDQKLTRNQYVASLLDTIFVPCPPGNNLETFRLYEALECGSIPLYVKSPGDEAYVEWLQTELGLLPVSSWEEAAALMVHFFQEKDLLEGYRNTLLIRWKQWKLKLGQEVRKVFHL
jgi:hypothetical protein